ALHLPGDARLVVSVGMLVHGKGHHLLVRALARLRPKYPDLRLAILGGPAHEPKYPQALQALVQNLGLSGAVILAGSQPPEQVVRSLQAADLFALATFDEGCCNAVLEALACGLPVVSTPVGENAALVGPPERGLIVPVDDLDALTEGLENALARTWD